MLYFLRYCTHNITQTNVSRSSSREVIQCLKNQNEARSSTQYKKYAIKKARISRDQIINKSNQNEEKLISESHEFEICII